MSMTTVNVHGVTALKARMFAQALTICAETKSWDDHEDTVEVVLFSDDVAALERIAKAINQAASDPVEQTEAV